MSSLCIDGSRHPQGVLSFDCDACRKASVERIKHWKKQAWNLCESPCTICDKHRADLHPTQRKTT